MTDGYIKVLMKNDPKSRRQGIKFKGNVLFLNNDKEENDIDTLLKDSTILTSKDDVNDERSSEEVGTTRVQLLILRMSKKFIGSKNHGVWGNGSFSDTFNNHKFLSGLLTDEK